MRRTFAGTPPVTGTLEQKVDWLIQTVGQIALASHDDAIERFDEYDTTNVTETRTFDADATTVEELADVLGTLITDMKERQA